MARGGDDPAPRHARAQRAHRVSAAQNAAINPSGARGSHRSTIGTKCGRAWIVHYGRTTRSHREAHSSFRGFDSSRASPGADDYRGAVCRTELLAVSHGRRRVGVLHFLGDVRVGRACGAQRRGSRYRCFMDVRRGSVSCGRIRDSVQLAVASAKRLQAAKRVAEMCTSTRRCTIRRRLRSMAPRRSRQRDGEHPGRRASRRRAR